MTLMLSTLLADSIYTFVVFFVVSRNKLLSRERVKFNRYAIPYLTPKYIRRVHNSEATANTVLMIYAISFLL